MCGINNSNAGNVFILFLDKLKKNKGICKYAVAKIY